MSSLFSTSGGRPTSTEAQARAGTNNASDISPLRLAQSVGLTQSSHVATYTVLSSDYILYADTSGGAFEFDLPAASSVPNKRYIFQYTDSGFANALTIDPNLTDTINGAATITLNTQRETVELVSDGVSNWVILRRDIPSIIFNYTPASTGTWTTNTTWTGKFQRTNKNWALIQATATLAGAPNSTSLLANLPTGLTIDTASLTESGLNSLGTGTATDAATDNYLVRVNYNNTTRVGVYAVADDSGAASAWCNVSNLLLRRSRSPLRQLIQ